jgi:SAM-dependent methyltransferase
MPAVESRWIERVRNTWNERADAWDAMSEENAQTADRVADLDRLMAALQLREGSRLLDAGCGTGQFAIAFARRGCRVTGIDVAPAMIERARQHARDAKLEVDWRIGDHSLLADPDATYDALFARMVLHFSEDVPQTFHELRRVLKPSGRLCVSVPGSLSPIYGEAWRRHLEPEQSPLNFMVPWELENLLSHFGWEVLDQWGDTSAAGPGRANELADVSLDQLDKRLRQAIATTWTFVAQ